MTYRALVVEDEPVAAAAHRAYVERVPGFAVVAVAHTGVEARRALTAGGIDLVLLDYNMPGFNGLETLAEIKRMAPHVTVVMITSTEDATVAAKAQELGAAFLKKPFYPSDIDAVLDRVDAAGPVR
jgi:response regulator of citrate/malate metabolism